MNLTMSLLLEPFDNLDESCKLLEVGLEYVYNISGKKVLKKAKK